MKKEEEKQEKTIQNKKETIDLNDIPSVITYIFPELKEQKRVKRAKRERERERERERLYFNDVVEEEIFKHQTTFQIKKFIFFFKFYNVYSTCHVYYLLSH